MEEPDMPSVVIVILELILASLSAIAGALLVALVMIMGLYLLIYAVFAIPMWFARAIRARDAQGVHERLPQ
jgi:hypothetical protein